MTLVGSHILDTGKSPEEWADILAARGITISPRTLREKANALGACHKLGRAMIITPDQMDLILQGGTPCRSKSMPVVLPGGFGAGSNSTESRSPATTAAALAHLKKQAQGTGAGRKKSGRSGVISLATRQG